MNTTPRPNHPAADPFTHALPISPHGTYDDRPLDMMTTSEIRSYISQMRQRYSTAPPNSLMRDLYHDTHRDLMAEFRARTA